MLLAFQARLADQVRDRARTLFDSDVPAVTFQYTPRSELGDLALTTPFDLAKVLRRKPREIAEQLAPALADLPGVARAQVAGGGYVNLFLERGAFAHAFDAWLHAGCPTEPHAGRVIVEHTSINPNKAAHIGHLRNAVLGDTFVRLLRFRGHQVGVQNYIDDTGVQVADVVVGFQHIEGLTLAQVAALPGKFDYYCWDLYARVADFYASSPQNKARQASTLHAIEAGDNDTARLAAHIAERIVDCHLATMARLGIRYDLLAHESDILRLRFWEQAFAALREAGAIRLEHTGKSAGCWVLAMNAEGQIEGADEDKIIVRSNGTVTYTGKDIAYQLWKLGLLDRDFHYRRHATDHDGHVLWATTSAQGEPGAPAFGHAQSVYNVIDVGQSYPQRVVKAGVAALGHAQGAAGSHHLAYEKVVLSPATARALGYAVSEDDASVKVSGRKGLGVKADDLLDLLTSKADEELAARDQERGEARDAVVRNASARAIATGALRYFLLKYGRNKVITFDMQEALAFTGETGPYIQNAVVRARSIFAKLAEDGHDVAALLQRAEALDLGVRLAGEEGDEIWALLFSMARTEDVAEQALRAQEVPLVARHAFQLAQAFHAYYQKPQYSLKYAHDDDQRALRVRLVHAFVRQLETLCGLLGIPLPDRM